jgi:hypothetical protein
MKPSLSRSNASLGPSGELLPVSFEDNGTVLLIGDNEIYMPKGSPPLQTAADLVRFLAEKEFCAGRMARLQSPFYAVRFH